MDYFNFIIILNFFNFIAFFWNDCAIKLNSYLFFINWVPKKTEEIYPKLLTLPLHPDLSLNDLIYISTKLKMFIEKNC